MSQERYPLTWPSGWKRTDAHDRLRANWTKTVYVDARNHQTGADEKKKTNRELNVADAAERLERQLDALGATDAILSTNVELRMDGRPKAGRIEPYDTGAAVYFKLKGKDRCLACDKWQRVADNINALALHIDALRRMDRYGIGDMEQAFAGYTALPQNASPWWTILEFDERPAEWVTVLRRYHELLKKHHPDRGGSVETMAKINAARDAARFDLEKAIRA
jgi:hypothetical protein